MPILIVEKALLDIGHSTYAKPHAIPCQWTHGLTIESGLISVISLNG